VADVIERWRSSGMTPESSKAGAWVRWLFAVLTSAALAFPAQRHLTRFPRGLLTDDAYFYVKIAWNLGGGRGSTFDGLHVTDGYHLLWAWILASVSAVVGWFTAEPWFHLGAMLWVYFMLCWVIALTFGRSWIDWLLLLSMGVVFKVMMETTLLSLVLIACAREYLEPPASRRRWSRAALCALIPLVRIDAALIAGVLALSSLFSDVRNDEPGRRRWRSVAVDWAAVAAGAALQLLLHFRLFGRWSTVSMELKGFESIPFLARITQNLTGLYLQNSLSLMVFALLWGLAIAAATRQPRRQRSCALVVLAAPAVFVLFHLVANVVINYWYFVPAAYLHVWYFLRYTPHRDRGLGPVGRGAMAMVLLLFLAKWVVDTGIRARQHEWARTFVEELKQRVPPNEPIFQIDASGWVGWFSARAVINGDGLVNDHTYAERLSAGALAGYLDEQRIHYIVTNVYPVDNRLVQIAGLVVPLDAVEPVIAQPEGFPRGTAFGLFRLK
jgi:hypothetical protein